MNEQHHSPFVHTSSEHTSNSFFLVTVQWRLFADCVNNVGASLPILHCDCLRLVRLGMCFSRVCVCRLHRRPAEPCVS